MNSLASSFEASLANSFVTSLVNHFANIIVSSSANNRVASSVSTTLAHSANGLLRNVLLATEDSFKIIRMRFLYANIVSLQPSKDE